MRCSDSRHHLNAKGRVYVSPHTRVDKCETCLEKITNNPEEQLNEKKQQNSTVKIVKDPVKK